MLTRKNRRSRSVYAAILVLALNAACSRRIAAVGNDGGGQNPSRDVPFHSDSVANGTADSASRPGVPETSSTKSVPFDSSALPVVPAGTLLTVRLENALTSSKPDSGKTFLAVIEDAVVIDGRTVIPRDAEVKGRVESARISNTNRTGYLRVTLDSIRLADKQIPLPTSSLFARALIVSAGDDFGAQTTPVSNRPGIVRLQKGRRLTFRLTAPVDFSRPTPPDEQAQTSAK